MAFGAHIAPVLAIFRLFMSTIVQAHLAVVEVSAADAEVLAAVVVAAIEAAEVVDEEDLVVEEVSEQAVFGRPITDNTGGGGGRGGIQKGGRGGPRGGGRGAPRGGRGGRGGGRGGASVVLEPHRHAGIFLAKGKEHMLVTKNLVPGESVYGEKRISIEGGEDGAKTEYRVWNPFRSKLAAGVLGGLDHIYIAPGAKVLYLGAASGTSVSHVADIVGPVSLFHPLLMNILMGYRLPTGRCGLRRRVFTSLRPRPHQHG